MTDDTTIEITDGQFYFAEVDAAETIHTTRQSAIGHLKQEADNLDPDNTDVRIVEVRVSGDDWAIKELPWQKIALELLNGGDL